jgi:hypothetical protein
MRRTCYHLKPLAYLVASIAIVLSGVWAAQAREGEGNLGEVDTIWPGIRFQLVRVEHIPTNRLLAVIRILATPQAPASGTLIGTKVSVPPDATKQDLIEHRYAPRPFSLSASQMIHEQTEQRFPALPPAASARRSYVSSDILRTLFPGQAEILTLQFSLPPGVASVDNALPKQTATFLLTNAKAPITKVPIPPRELVDEPDIEGR